MCYGLLLSYELNPRGGVVVLRSAERAKEVANSTECRTSRLVSAFQFKKTVIRTLLESDGKDGRGPF
ncbi:hypothetical protein I3842_07G104700 [Carya illinoinensis]|uniref:Uncharacterized protein n=1 Tax=Carya illinoinensis TaxID=32201 RepID=A0A922EHG8_CARIL|nr:hypothetical protein I3842_07G104700 [Carya illinoinensis]